MHLHLAMLISDWLIYGLLGIVIIIFVWARHYPHLREPWKEVIHKPLGMISLVILIFYICIGLLDSIHFENRTLNENNHYSESELVSLLDLMVSPLGQQPEESYSAPFATHLYSQSIITLSNGQEIRAYPRLEYGGSHLKNIDEKMSDITSRALKGLLFGIISFIAIASFFTVLLSLQKKIGYKNNLLLIIKGKTYVAWRATFITFGLIWILIWICAELATHYHIFGTDKVGNDVFYESIKSIRTGLLIGTLTTLFTLPFALILGTIAGYYRAWADDIIQYLYTTLSSIPGVLLITASVLVLQVYISNHPTLFPTLIQRADARLLALCFILGITSWASLCRFLRAETLKLREHEFIQASLALGVSSQKIIFRHIFPNIMHIVLITLVLDFSSLVLAEAVLSYIGVGVDPTTLSWGNMINSARLELAREPIVWWPLLAALVFMFFLVLAANIFSDVVRDAFDPRLRHLEE